MNKFIYLIFALLCIVKLTKSDKEGEERIAKEQTDEFSKTSSNVAASLDSITDVLSDSEFLAKSDNDRDASRTERSAVNDDNVKQVTEKSADEELKTSGAVDDLYNKESKNDNEMESKNDNERSGDDSSVSKLDDNSESRNDVKMDENPDNESRADDSLDNVQKSDEPIDVLNKSDKQEESSLDKNDSPILREGISAPENLIREFTSEDTIQLDKPDTSLLNFEGTRRMLNPVVDEAAKSAVKTAVNVEQYVKSVAEPDYISRTISNVNDFDSRRNYAGEVDTPHIYHTRLLPETLNYPVQHFPKTVTPVIVQKISEKDIFSALDANSRKLLETPMNGLSKDVSSTEEIIGADDLMHNAYPYASMSTRSGHYPQVNIKPQLPYSNPNANIFRPSNQHQIPYYSDFYKPFNSNYFSLGLGQSNTNRFIHSVT